MGFGKDLKAAREKKGLTLRYVALQAGISATYLSKIEREEFKPCGVEKLTKIAEVLELDPDVTCLKAGKIPHWIKDIIFSLPEKCIEFFKRERS